LIKDKQDFWSGMMFMAVGAGFSFQATSYSMGSAARMGPGYFPFWLGVVLALMGAVVMISSLAKRATETSVTGFDFKILALVIGSVVLYGVLLRPLGLYLSLAVLVIISSLASHEFNWKVAVANALFLIVFAYLAFIRGLGLIFPLWPAALSN